MNIQHNNSFVKNPRWLMFINYGYQRITYLSVLCGGKNVGSINNGINQLQQSPKFATKFEKKIKVVFQVINLFQTSYSLS